MKIKKSQLRRIIAEEKARLQNQVNEDVIAMTDLQDAVNSAGFNVATMFSELMNQLPREMEPDRISPTWADEVEIAEEVLEKEIKAAINAAVNKVESQLHDGAFSRGSR